MALTGSVTAPDNSIRPSFRRFARVYSVPLLTRTALHRARARPSLSN